jgi:osmotically inducible protein OsmC
MKVLNRKATAIWKGPGADGKGALTSGSGALKDQPYSFHTRFGAEDGKAGTNPEELIAAAHAGCFAMALSFGLTGAGHPPEQLEVSAALRMENPDTSWTIKSIKLTVAGKVPGITQEKFTELANGAKANCPVSRVLKAEITLEATLL